MVSVKQVLVAAALLALGQAAPSHEGFSVTQVVKNEGFKTSGPHAMMKTYKKFNKQAPPEVINAANTNPGTVAATPQQFDSEYLCPVSIGGQTLQLDFDTGSSDLWVFSTLQPASQRAGHTAYNPSSSSTSRVLSGYSWSITYGDGSSSSGAVYTDNVAIGASVVNGQAVEAAQTVSAQFQQGPGDGLVGLAFDSINTVSPQQQRTFFSNAKGSLPAPVFTANLKKGAVGNYNFGYINSAEHSGTITYIPVNTANGFWEFTGNGYAVGTGGFVSTSIDGIADTGTTLLYLPSGAVTAYYRRVSGAVFDNNQGGYTFPCNAALPSITLGLGSYRAVVPGSYINYAPVSSTTCFGGIQPNTGIGFSIYGDIFLKSQFVVFDGHATPRLGFAPK